VAEFPPRGPLADTQLEIVHTALVKAFATDELARLLAFRWGVRLDEEIDVRGGKKTVVGELLDWTQREGRTRELLILAAGERPQNQYVQDAAAQVLAGTAPQPWLYGAAPPPAAPASLEAMVSSRSVLVSMSAFNARAQALERGVCRVEGVCQGTGFLIGRQTVLTNYHVVEKEVLDPGLRGGIVCRFDFQGGAPGTTVSVAAGSAAIGPASPYSNSDLTASGEPGPSELDFAVIRLAEPVEASRFHWRLPETAAVVLPGDVAVVVEYPGNAELSIAYGVVTEFPGTGRRYRYTCTTSPGASGSPLLSADLQLIGLHHAADPAKAPRYNQAIPIHLIGRTLVEAKIDLGAL
jgi:S1-C subfamily serine protease